MIYWGYIPKKRKLKEKDEGQIKAACINSGDTRSSDSIMEDLSTDPSPSGCSREHLVLLLQDCIVWVGQTPTAAEKLLGRERHTWAWQGGLCTCTVWPTVATTEELSWTAEIRHEIRQPQALLASSVITRGLTVWSTRHLPIGTYSGDNVILSKFSKASSDAGRPAQAHLPHTLDNDQSLISRTHIKNQMWWYLFTTPVLLRESAGTSQAT